MLTTTGARRWHSCLPAVACALALVTGAPSQRTVPDRPVTTDQVALRESAATASIKLTDAVARALARVPGIALRASFERVRVDQQLVPRYEVEVLAADGYYEVQVDATDGSIVAAEPQSASRAERHGEMRFDFEQEELPFGFEPKENAGTSTPASWRTERTEDAPDGKRAVVVESANKRFAYNLLLRRGRVGPDLSVSVRLQAWKGEEDQGGGLVWRAQNDADYYIARWNPLETNLRLYTTTDGKRSAPIQSVEIDADPTQWHELHVTMIGSRIVIRFDGKIVMEVEDTTYTEAGAVGLWTKADASTRFDSLRILPH